MKSVLFVLAVALSTAACSAAPGDRDRDPSGDTSDALSAHGPTGDGPIGIHLPPPPPPPPPSFPPADASYCPAVEPSCSLMPWGMSEVENELAGLGCSPSWKFFTGYPAGMIGGIFTLCNDSLVLRSRFPWATNAPFAETCTACIPAAPSGELYVLLEAFVGPNCQSGCISIGNSLTSSGGVGTGGLWP